MVTSNSTIVILINNKNPGFFGLIKFVCSIVDFFIHFDIDWLVQYCSTLFSYNVVFIKRFEFIVTVASDFQSFRSFLFGWYDLSCVSNNHVSVHHH